MIHIIADLLVIAIVGLCAYSGYRKGFFLPLMRIVGAIVSFICTYLFADRFVESINDYFFRDGVLHLLSTRVPVTAVKDADMLKESVAGSLSLEGVYDSVSSYLSGRAVEEIAAEGVAKGNEVIAAVAGKIADSLSYAFVFVILFVVLNGLFILVVMAINASFKLPVVRMPNKIAGMTLGAVFGLFIVCLLLCAATWCWPFVAFNFSLPGPNAFIDGTRLIKFLTQYNPIEILFKWLL